MGAASANWPAKVRKSFVTFDETWIHHYTPETKEQSKQWVEAGGSPPKRLKTQQSAGKVMASVFWDVLGIILIYDLKKEKTIIAQYYSELLDRFDTAINAKRPHLARKKILSNQDRHTKQLKRWQNWLNWSRNCFPTPVFTRFGLLRLLSVPKLKEMAGSKEIELLEARWNKCIELKGNYIEE